VNEEEEEEEENNMERLAVVQELAKIIHTRSL
jgi:hypothetical protein